MANLLKDHDDQQPNAMSGLANSRL